MHCSIVSGKSMPWQTPNKGQRRIFITSSLPFPNAWLKPGCWEPQAPHPSPSHRFSPPPVLSFASMHWFRNSFWKLCLPKSLLKSGIECWSIMGLCTMALQTSTMHRPITIITLFDRNVSLFLFTRKYKSVFSAKLRRICLHNEACPFLSGDTGKQWQKKERNWPRMRNSFFLNYQSVYKITLFPAFFSWIFYHLALGRICRIVLGADKYPACKVI